VRTSTCPYCYDGVSKDEATSCPECGAPHHEDCFAENNGCAVTLCAGGPKVVVCTTPRDRRTETSGRRWVVELDEPGPRRNVSPGAPRPRRGRRRGRGAIATVGIGLAAVVVVAIVLSTSSATPHDDEVPAPGATPVVPSVSSEPRDVHALTEESQLLDDLDEALSSKKPWTDAGQEAKEKAHKRSLAESAAQAGGETQPATGAIGAGTAPPAGRATVNASPTKSGTGSNSSGASSRGRHGSGSRARKGANRPPELAQDLGFR
jgi:hypothetical protein